MKIAVIGLGYVGLPLATVFAEAGIEVIGVEAVAERCHQINAGHSYIQDVTSEALGKIVEKGLIRATTDYAATEDCDAVIICLPTPLNANREPDLTLVKDATEKLAGHLRRGQLVTLESTTYPGTTRDELAPLLEAGVRPPMTFGVVLVVKSVRPGSTRSGEKARKKSTPAFMPDASSRIGASTSRVVPG